MALLHVSCSSLVKMRKPKESSRRSRSAYSEIAALLLGISRSCFEPTSSPDPLSLSFDGSTSPTRSPALNPSLIGKKYEIFSPTCAGSISQTMSLRCCESSMFHRVAWEQAALINCSSKPCRHRNRSGKSCTIQRSLRHSLLLPSAALLV